VGVIRRLGGVPVAELQQAQTELAVARAWIAAPEAQTAKTTEATPDFVTANRPKKAAGEPRQKREVTGAR
jgi:hypothetical protein